MRIDYRWLNENGVCQESIDLLFQNIQRDSIDIVELASRMINELTDTDINEWFCILYGKLLMGISRHSILSLMVNNLEISSLAHEEILPLCTKIANAVNSQSQLDSNFGKLVREHITTARNKYSSHSDVTSIDAYQDYSLILYLDAINSAYKAINSDFQDLCLRAARVPFFIYKSLCIIEKVVDDSFDKTELLELVWLPVFESFKERVETNEMEV